LQKRDSIDFIEGQHPDEEDLKDNTKRSWVVLDGEKTSKSKIEEVTSCSPLDPLCVQENNKKKQEI